MMEANHIKVLGWPCLTAVIEFPDQRFMRNFVMGVTGKEWKLLSEKQLHCYLNTPTANPIIKKKKKTYQHTQRPTK